MNLFNKNSDITKDIGADATIYFNKLYKFYLKCFCVFLIGIFIFDIYFGIFTTTTVFNIIFFIFSFYMIFNIEYFSDFLLSTMFLSMNFYAFYASSYCGRESGISLLYFHLIFSIIYLFELRQLRKTIGVLIFQILVLTIINFKTNFKLFYNPIYTPEKQSVLFVYISISTISLTLALIYILVKKQDLIIKLYKQKENEYNRLFKTSKLQNISIDQIKELNILARNNSPSFFSEFCIAFPQLIKSLKKEDYNLNQKEVEICLYIFLNYNTKEIARFTNKTIKTVESNKYRIRKKLNLPPNSILTAQFLLNI